MVGTCTDLFSFVAEGVDLCHFSTCHVKTCRVLILTGGDRDHVGETPFPPPLSGSTISSGRQVKKTKIPELKGKIDGHDLL